MKVQFEIEFNEETDGISASVLQDILNMESENPMKVCAIQSMMPSDDEILSFLNGDKTIRFSKDSATFKNVKQALEHFVGVNKMIKQTEKEGE